VYDKKYQEKMEQAREKKLKEYKAKNAKKEAADLKK
jgi:hypothetical protein